MDSELAEQIAKTINNASDGFANQVQSSAFGDVQALPPAAAEEAAAAAEANEDASDDDQGMKSEQSAVPSSYKDRLNQMFQVYK